jgi:Domain of unknown function (DUF4276)
MKNDIKIGIIAEDETDINTFKEIIQRIFDEKSNRKFRAVIQGRQDGGCGKIVAKGTVWAKELFDKGYNNIIIIHDLDRSKVNNALNNINKLRLELNRIQFPSNSNSFICIPVEEIEAWFWSDDKIIKKIGKGRGKAHLTPELIVKPKEKLITLSRDKGKKPLYDTNDNETFAKILDLEICRARCPSFDNLVKFLLTL